MPAHADRGPPDPASGIAGTRFLRPHPSSHRFGYGSPTLANARIPLCPSAGKTRCGRRPASPSVRLQLGLTFAPNTFSPVPQAYPSSGILAETAHSQALGFVRVSFVFAETGLEAQIARGVKSFLYWFSGVSRSIKAHSRPEQGSGRFLKPAEFRSGNFNLRKQNPLFSTNCYACGFCKFAILAVSTHGGSLALPPHLDALLFGVSRLANAPKRRQIPTFTSIAFSASKPRTPCSA